MKIKRIAVIGGGYCGIVSIATLKQDGLEPVCFERSDKYGGTWCYRKDTRFAEASIMPTTIINHSKEMGAMSNFPPRKEFSNYMKHTELYQYITDYVKHHDCEKHINYNTEVLNVKKAEDYAETGRWSVTTKRSIDGRESTEIFDGVLVCTGHINMPTIPTFAGKDKFEGKIMHTHSLKEVEGFKNQNVVVVGTGCSALDAAVEISRVAKQVYLSTRCGAFIFNRVGPNGYPIDGVLLRRYLTILLSTLPTYIVSWYLETFYINNLFNQKLYHIEPKYHVLSKDPIINDQIAAKLLSGSVIQKANILYFTEKGVVFEEEEEHETKVDTVIMATGYTWGFPFIEEGVIIKKDGIINLYKCMYPPHLSHPTLAIIGFINPFGPGFPLAELQIRWASYMLANNSKLPSEHVMMKDITKRHKENLKRYIPYERMSVRCDYVQYMDEIAHELGVMPKILKYLFTDFPLFLRLVFRPCLSYQFRLEGHGKWEGAREAIMTSDQRLHWPLQKNKPVKRGIFQYVIDYIVNLLPLNIFVLHY